MNPKERLQLLQEGWRSCQGCGLGALRSPNQEPVFGAGPENADVLIVTAAPTAADMQSGNVLSTSDGAALQSILKDAGLPLSRVHVTSLVCCHPYLILPATETEPALKCPRDPTKTEIEACWPRLTQTILAIDPRLIIALGETVWYALIPPDRRKERKISDAAGSLYRMRVQGHAYPLSYDVLALLSIKQITGNPSTAIHGPTTASTVFINDKVKEMNMLKNQEKK